ncbi:MAG: RHS repeat-associated core domain-containing protein [Phycisphaeraceae bacterium]|nr:RHS repeat-associated core domain-containing protein [Phycisphaeraceae bacterium]
MAVTDGGDPATTIVTYRYNGLGHRVSRILWDNTDPQNPVIDTKTDYYYNAGWQVVEERVDGDVHIQYLWCLSYIDTPVLRWRDTTGNEELDETLYYTVDANKNVTALIDAATGNVVERYLYDPYGRVMVLKENWSLQEVDGHDHGTVSAFGNEILFTGYRYNPETGTYHARNREYHPLLGRFMQRDPLGYVDGGNLYAAYFAMWGGVDPEGLAIIRLEDYDQVQVQPLSTLSAIPTTGSWASTPYTPYDATSGSFAEMWPFPSPDDAAERLLERLLWGEDSGPLAFELSDDFLLCLQVDFAESFNLCDPSIFVPPCAALEWPRDFTDLTPCPNFFIDSLDDDHESSWGVLDYIQTGLDVGGVVPVIGIPCDLTNGLIYLCRGDLLNAGLSCLAAAPLAGAAINTGRIGAKTVDAAASATRRTGSVRGALPGAGRLWGRNRFVREIHDQGFVLRGPTRRDNGLIYTNPTSGAEVRIMPRPNRKPYRGEPLEKFQGDFYYRYRPGPDRPWGPHQSLPGG